MTEQTEGHQRRLEYLSLDELHFDPENPRFPSDRSGRDRSQILGWLLSSANLPDLMRSIAAQGFFPGEPLLVSPRSDGGYRVVEGNRRFASCWLLSHPDDAPVKTRTVAQIAGQATQRPTVLPCLVLPESEILGFLGYRHITGIQEWSPLAKARYLDRLWGDSDGPDDWDARLRWVASRIGSRADYVARLLTALEVFNYVYDKNFFHISGLDEESLSFSLLALALNRPALANFIGLPSGQDFEFESLDDTNLESLVRWFFERDESGRTVLGESRNVTKLVQVVANSEALELLRGGSTLQRAHRMITHGTSPLLDHVTAARDAISAAADVAAAVRVDDVGLANQVQEVLDVIENNVGEVRARIAGQIR